MNAAAVVCCTLCREPVGAPRAGFQLVESRWADRLMVFRFQEALALRPGVFNVCSTAHVREMVVHWMTTGRLDFPFASAPLGTGRLFLRGAKKECAGLDGLAMHSGFVGELSIHRESLRRVLRKNPQALSPVLEALIEVIQSDDSQAAHLHTLDQSGHSRQLLV